MTPFVFIEIILNPIYFIDSNPRNSLVSLGIYKTNVNTRPQIRQLSVSQKLNLLTAHKFGKNNVKNTVNAMANNVSVSPNQKYCSKFNIKVILNLNER